MMFTDKPFTINTEIFHKKTTIVHFDFMITQNLKALIKFFDIYKKKPHK